MTGKIVQAENLVSFFDSFCRRKFRKRDMTPEKIRECFSWTLHGAIFGAALGDDTSVERAEQESEIEKAVNQILKGA